MTFLQSLMTLETLWTYMFGIGAFHLFLGLLQYLTKFKWFPHLPAWTAVSPLSLLGFVVFGPIWLALIALTIWTAFVALIQIAQAAAGVGANDVAGSAQNSGLGGLGLGAMLTAILGAPFLIWSTVLKHQTLRYQKEGHITDRITKAVEQLGSEKTVKKRDKETTVPNIEVRIGAILSLERIAQDSTAHDKGRDHVRVMEVLCAYIRHNAPASEAKDHDFGEWEPLKDDPTEEERSAHLARRKERFGSHYTESKVYKWAQTLPEPRADIAIALRVIGRRTAAQRLAEARWGKNAGPNDEWVFDAPCPILPDEPTPDDLSTYPAKLQVWEKRFGITKAIALTCAAQTCNAPICPI
jgi:hypothetical protein